MSRKMPSMPLQPAARALFWLLACPASLALAQGTASPVTLPPVVVRGEAPETNGRLNLDTPVETGSRLGLTPRQTPATVTVVDRATIEARGAQDTQEILRAIPGITAHNAPGSIGVSYRGFSATSLTQLFNGINVQYTIAARPVDSWIYDRVEAIGGASSFLHGAGGVGGTINYITKVAERADFTDAQVRLGSDNLKEASFGVNRRLWSEGGAGNQHFIRLDYNQRNADSWTDGTDIRSKQLAASLLSDLWRGVSHTLAYEFQDERVARPYWGTPLLNPAVGTVQVDERTRFRNYNSADGIYNQRVGWLRSVTDWKASEALQFKNTFYVYDALRDYRNVEVYTFNASNTAVARSATLLQRHDQRLTGNKVEGLFKGAIGDRRSDWAFGVDFSVNRQTRFPNSLAGTVSTVDPFVFTTENFFSIPGMKPGFVPDRDNRVTTTAAYVENRTALVPSLNLVTAMRHERIELELTNRRAVTAAAPASFERVYTPTTGRVGLVWDLAPGANAYVQYATAADPPSGILSTASFADVINNNELTTGRQLEVGTRFDFWQQRGTATVAVYDITRRNIASQDPANSALTVLVGEQSARGIEIAAGVKATRALSIQGNVALVDPQFEVFRQGGVSFAGKTPANTPSKVANLWASYLFTPEWQGIVGVRYVGSVYANNANTQQWPSYTLLDLGLSYRMSRASTITARLRNATDRVYAANVTSAMAYLGPPRTADLTLRLAF